MHRSTEAFPDATLAQKPIFRPLEKRVPLNRTHGGARPLKRDPFPLHHGDCIGGATRYAPRDIRG
jgi:hypothetical protein